MSFSGKSTESRLRQPNSRLASVTGSVKNAVSSLGKSLSGLLQKNHYSPPPAPPTTPIYVFDGDEDVGVADEDAAEIALESTSYPLCERRSSISAANDIHIESVSADENVHASSCTSARRKVSQPIPIPKIRGNRDQPERAERKERLYI